jgi:hypothetical protein
MFYKGTEGTQIYTRTMAIFRTAAALYGQSEVDRIFATFFARYRFRHPGQADFFGVVEEVASPELSAFLVEAFMQPRIPDYAVVEAESEEWSPPWGSLRVDGDRILVTPENEGSEEHALLGLDPAAREPDGQVQMIVSDPGFVSRDDRRDGSVARRWVNPTVGESASDYEADPDLYFATKISLRGPRWKNLPVEIRFRFADGVEIRDVWDGRAAWRSYRFVRGAPLIDVLLDPDDKLAIDANPQNDGRRIEPDRRKGRDWSTWLTAVAAWLVTGASWWL